jgi:hypothetical protein
MYKNYSKYKKLSIFCLDIPEEGLQPKLVEYVLYLNKTNLNFSKIIFAYKQNNFSFKKLTSPNICVCHAYLCKLVRRRLVLVVVPIRLTKSLVRYRLV